MVKLTTIREREVLMLIGELCGDSAKQVQRYIKMTELIPELLLDKVDDGSQWDLLRQFSCHYLKKKEQQEIIGCNGGNPVYAITFPGTPYKEIKCGWEAYSKG